MGDEENNKMVFVFQSPKKKNHMLNFDIEFHDLMQVTISKSNEERWQLATTG